MLRPPDFTELRALHDCFHRNADAVVVLWQFLHDFIEEGLIGELHFAAQGVTEELLTEVAKEGLPAIVEKVGAESVEAIDRFPVREFRLGISHRAAATDGVVAFERKAVGIDPVVTLGAGGIGTVPCDEFTFGEPLGNSVGKLRNILGRLGKALAQESF